MVTIRIFNTLSEARLYRHEHGTGGWIFENEITKIAVLFPPDMTPSAIFKHPMTLGWSGNLIGHG